jgi:hypothetical protein
MSSQKFSYWKLILQNTDDNRRTCHGLDYVVWLEEALLGWRLHEIASVGQKLPEFHSLKSNAQFSVIAINLKIGE